jgi:hypothetical protein
MAPIHAAAVYYFITLPTPILLHLYPGGTGTKVLKNNFYTA